jgi:DNA topoisomerase-3
MANQIVITEKSSQAKDVRAAIGSRYGDILGAEGHLLDLLDRKMSCLRGSAGLRSC